MNYRLLIYLTHPHVEAWNFHPRQVEFLKTAFPQATLTVCPNSREFLARLPEADGVVVWFFKRAWLAEAKNLKFIATPAAGGDWIEVEPSASLKIFFGSFHGLMMAESVVGAIFYFCKAFALSKKKQAQHKWARIKISNQLASLHRARVTILGLGKIGRVIGRVLKPYGCYLTGVKRTPSPAPDYFTAEDRVVTMDQLPQVLKTTDHLIMVLPGGEGTAGIFSRELFQLLPPRCIIYNVGRGNVYKEEDLVAALESGEIAGAYLDVFATEPLPASSPLWDMEPVLIQPHLAAASPQYLDLFVEELVATMKREI